MCVCVCVCVKSYLFVSIEVWNLAQDVLECCRQKDDLILLLL